MLNHAWYPYRTFPFSVDAKAIGTAEADADALVEDEEVLLVTGRGGLGLPTAMVVEVVVVLELDDDLIVTIGGAGLPNLVVVAVCKDVDDVIGFGGAGLCAAVSRQQDNRTHKIPRRSTLNLIVTSTDPLD